MNLYPDFYNDVFGPIMQPGSSSHMAGPCRVTYLCNSLLGADPVKRILIELDKDGSLAGTMGSMNEDLGIYNGAAGRLVDHPDFFNIYEYMKENGIEYEMSFCTMKESTHANAIKCTLTGESGRTVSLVGDSIGGGMVQTVWVNGYRLSVQGDTPVLCLFDAENRLSEKTADALVSNQGILEKGKGEGKNGGTLYWYKISEDITEKTADALKEIDWSVLAPLLPVPTTLKKQPQLFDTMTEWRRIAAEQGKSMVDVAVDYEIAASGWTKDQIVDYMREKVQKTLQRRVYAVANKEVDVPYKAFFSPTWKLWGDNMADAKLVKGLFARALYYVFSARTVVPGVLNVPGPQGNGGGFLAGVLYAVKEELDLTEDDILRGLFIAAGIGAICYTRTAPTGEVIGCAGEVGICSAMTAAAIVEMLHGTPEQTENAASFALQAAIGWPCDIIPGGYGMPCGSRIMHLACMSITYAQFALIGENPRVPFHEVVDVADEVGKMYPEGMHCSGRGGMCNAPAAVECGRVMKEELAKNKK